MLSYRTETTKTKSTYQASAAGPTAAKRQLLSALVLLTVVFVTVQLVLLWNLDRSQQLQYEQQLRPWLDEMPQAHIHDRTTNSLRNERSISRIHNDSLLKMMPLVCYKNGCPIITKNYR
jgi:type II secretory pathway component PulL